MKRLCDKCHALAVWNYVPGKDDPYYCESHVPRGCSCMVDHNGNPLKDEQGRELPCIEYDYSKNGFRVEL